MLRAVRVGAGGGWSCNQRLDAMNSEGWTCNWRRLELRTDAKSGRMEMLQAAGEPRWRTAMLRATRSELQRHGESAASYILDFFCARVVKNMT